MHVDGIITGIVKDKKVVAEKRPIVEKLFSNKYKVTLHIDNNMILRTVQGSGDFSEHELDVSDELWSKEAVKAIEEMEKNEKS